MSGFSSPTQKFLNLMIFIDGGYLRRATKDALGKDKIDFNKLRDFLRASCEYGRNFPDLIRTYYYDAIIERTERHEGEWTKQNKYFEEIRKLDFYEVRLGRLIRQGDGQYKQKGVDILLAVDMVTKAYESHYDVAFLVAGDDDMVELIRSVKDAGKRVYGGYFKDSASKRLVELFDRRFPLDEKMKELLV